MPKPIQYVPAYKPDASLVAAIRAAIQRHKLNNQLTKAVRAARSVA